MDIGLAIRTIRKQKQITIMQMCEGRVVKGLYKQRRK